MTKKERVFAALAGEPVDRPPVSFWRHFYPEETTAEGLASIMLDFQREFDWDFMKVNPRAVYHVEDWGHTYEFSTQSDQNHRLVSHRVQSASDWRSLEPLDPQQGTLGQHLEALKQIGSGLGGEVPFIMTIFNPISIAGHLVGDVKDLMAHIEQEPDAVKAGLEVITETFINFARACLDVGATGVFFPTTHYATSGMMTIEQYSEFGRPHDLRFLEAVQDAGLLMLHVCKSNCYLFELMDYPVHSLNWSTQDPTNPTVADAASRTELALVGGIDQGEALSAPTADAALEQARAARESLGDRPFLLGPGCTAAHTVNSGTLRAVRTLADEMGY